MKKFLEVLMDDDGLLHFSTDFCFADNEDNPPADFSRYASEMDDLHRRTIRSMITEVWNNKNQNPSKAIRILSMGEIISCAQPYDHAEQLWYSLMFDYIPHYEKFSSKLKRPYGFDPSKMIRPIKMGGPEALMTAMFPISPQKS